MSDRANSILAAAIELSREERIELTEKLLRTLDPEDDAAPGQAEVEAAWEAECDRRLEAYDRGEMESVPVEEIFDMLRHRGKP